MDLLLQGLYLPMRKVVTIQKNSYQYKKSYWIELQKKKILQWCAARNLIKGFLKYISFQRMISSSTEYVTGKERKDLKNLFICFPI